MERGRWNADGSIVTFDRAGPAGRVVHYSTGVVTTEDGAGRILAERLPDGTVLNAFDREGRPIGGTAPGGRPLRLQQPIDAPAMPPGDAQVAMGVFRPDGGRQLLVLSEEEWASRRNLAMGTPAGDAQAA